MATSPTPSALHAETPRLPRPPTPLIGRQTEHQALMTLLADADVRLVSLTGPGGVGKTRLALDVAAAAALAFPSGVWFVPLASVTDPNLVAPAIAQVLGLRESGETSLDLRIAGFIRDKQVLLLLDNMEQVVGAASLVAELLAACPGLRVLVTSRVRLNLSFEIEYAVSPLSVASPGGHAALDDPVASDAARLFVVRARAVRPGFALTENNAGAVAEICRRLDGVPLAIELAAAKIKVMTPKALLSRLDRRLPLLTGGARDVLPRQQTMRDTIGWSYDLLPSDEQTLFRRLSVFTGSFTLEAAELVMSDGSWDMDNPNAIPSPSPICQRPLPAVLDGVSSLVDKSLLRPVDAASDDVRLAMLETVREFALDMLSDEGEAEAARRAHAAWCRRLVEEARPFLEGIDQAVWMDRLDADHDNIRAGLAWTAANDPDLLLRLVAALWRFWVVRGHLSEGRARLERALELRADEGSPTWVDAVYGASVIANMVDDNDRAVALAEKLLTTGTARNDRSTIGKAHNLLGNVSLKVRDMARAKGHFEAAEAHLEAPADDAWIAVVLDNLGTIAQNEGRFADADVLLHQALAAWQRMGNAWGIAVAYHDLGDTSLNAGDRERAAHYFRESLALHAAERDAPGIAWGLERLGLIAAGRGDAETATRLFAAVARHAASLGIAFPDVPGRHETALASVRAALGEATFVAAWRAGERLTLTEAIATAIAVADGSPAPATWAEPPGAPLAAPDHPLTPRQQEILRLLVEGKSDREIADVLFISHRTTETHLARIYARLGVSTRSAAVAYAFRHGLVGPDTSDHVCRPRPTADRD